MAGNFTAESLRADLDTLYAAMDNSFDLGEPIPDAGARNTAPGTSRDWLTLEPGLLYGQYRADKELPAREPNYAMLGAGNVVFELDSKEELNEIHARTWDFAKEVREPNLIEFYFPEGKAPSGIEGQVYSEFAGKELAGISGTGAPLGRTSDLGKSKYPAFFFGGEFVLSLAIETDRVMVSFEQQKGKEEFLHPFELPRETAYDIAGRLATAYQKAVQA